MTKDQSDLEFLSAVQRNAPATIQDLCDAVGVTATAVRQKLMRFQADGLVARQVSKRDRGRPCHTYQLTPAGVKELGDDHAEIAAILWRQIMAIPEPSVRSTVLDGVKSAMVERFGDLHEGASLASRLQLLTSKLAERGFDLEYSQPDDASLLPVLKEHNCPYHELAAEDSSICDLEQSVFSELLGVPVELSACRLDGHQCCEFQVG